MASYSHMPGSPEVSVDGYGQKWVWMPLWLRRALAWSGPVSAVHRYGWLHTLDATVPTGFGPGQNESVQRLTRKAPTDAFEILLHNLSLSILVPRSDIQNLPLFKPKENGNGSRRNTIK